MECFRDPGHIALGLLAVVVIVLLALLIPTMAIFTLVGKTEKVQVCRWEECGVWREECGRCVDVKREEVVCGRRGGCRCMEECGVGGRSVVWCSVGEG